MVNLKKTLFVQSFRHVKVKEFLVVLLLNFLIILGVYTILLVGAMYMQPIINQLDAVDIDKFQSIQDLSQIPSKEEFIQAIQAMKGYVVGLGVYIVSVTLVTILIWSFFHSLIWAKILEKKIMVKYVLRFILLNFIWILLFLIPFVIFYILVIQEILVYLFILEVALLIYLTPILYVLFVTTNKYKTALKETVKVGLGNIYRFILPFVAAVIFLFVVGQIGWIFKIFPPLTVFIYIEMFIALAVLLGYVVWLEYYIKDLVLNVYRDTFKSWI